MSPLAFTQEVQRRLGVVADGAPGPQTMAALDQQLPSRKPTFPVSPLPPLPSSPPPSTSLLTADTLALAILGNARRFVGLKEVKPNAQWDNPATAGADLDLVKELRDRMRKAPWPDGAAYCAAFVEAMVVAALQQTQATPDQIKRFSSVMQPGVMNSYHAFKERALIHSAPAAGSIWLAQHGQTSQGHAGLVIRTEDVSKMLTIEANTSTDPNASGAQNREGDWITQRIRQRSGAGELHTLGFVRPSSILRLCGIAAN